MGRRGCTYGLELGQEPCGDLDPPRKEKPVKKRDIETLIAIAVVVAAAFLLPDLTWLI